jgi:hypothetical protein
MLREGSEWASRICLLWRFLATETQRAQRRFENLNSFLCASPVPSVSLWLYGSVAKSLSNTPRQTYFPFTDSGSANCAPRNARTRRAHAGQLMHGCSIGIWHVQLNPNGTAI